MWVGGARVHLVSQVLTLVLVLLVTSVTGQQKCDHCNCQISSVTDSRAVYSMSLICNTGTISWFGASGAVRLELTPFLHGNFRACFVAESQNTHVKISQESPHTSAPSNYRLKMEESRSLKLDHLLTARTTSKEFCVHSRNSEPLLLFLEAAKTPGMEGVAKVLFHYDVEKVDSKALLDPMEECRPCSKQELLDAYCSMDFVVIGTMEHVDHNEETGRSNITLGIKQVIHQREPQMFTRVKRSDRHLTGHVTMPRKCNMKKGVDDFLITGRVRLNTLALTCATYLHEWRRLQNQLECSHG